jgi:hypothetical protein
MATYGAAGEARALDRLGIVRPAGALDVGKGAFAMLGPEVVAKLAAVKTALPPVPGKATAPTVAKVAPLETTDVAAKLVHSLAVQQRMAALSPPISTGSAEPSRIDRLLASPWTAEELRELESGPRLVIEPDPGLTIQHAQGMLDCVRYKLRAAMAIRFDSPIPLLWTDTIWEYLKRNIGTIRIWRPTDNSRNAEGFVATRTVFLFSYPCGPMWSDPSNYGLGANGLTLLVHEARHIEMPYLAHNCSDAGVRCSDTAMRSGTCTDGFVARPFDESLEYGGAYAADYWTRRWLAEHSGDWLSPSQRLDMEASAWRMLTDQEYGPFCNRRDFPGRPAAIRTTSNPVPPLP